MNTDIDRRAVFFFGSACLCILLVPVTLPQFRWVGELLAATQVVLGTFSLLDHLSRRRRSGGR